MKSASKLAIRTGKAVASLSGAADIIDYHDLAARGIRWSVEEAI